MPTRPAVSVIVPAYNVEAFIGEAVESVLVQEEERFELIVVDDGSTDGTPDVLGRYDDPRMTVVRTENRGLSEARNLGMRRAQAPLLAFLDGDDRWRPQKLRHEIALFRSEPDVGVIFSNFTRFNDRGGSLPHQFLFYPGLSALATRPAAAGDGRVVTESAFEAFISFYDFPAFSTALTVRRSVIGELRFTPRWWDERGRLGLFEDLEFWPRIFRRTTVAFIPEVLSEMRRHGNNTTRDVGSLCFGQLNALRALETEPLNGSQRRALKRRIARQLVTVGRWHARERRPLQACRRFWEAARRGRVGGAAKGLALLPFHYLRGRAVPISGHVRVEGSGSVTSARAAPSRG